MVLPFTLLLNIHLNNPTVSRGHDIQHTEKYLAHCLLSHGHTDYNRKCFAWYITLQLCKRSYSPPKKGTNNPQLSAKLLSLEILVYHPFQNSLKSNAARHTMMFFSIFNNPSTFATSPTKVIPRTSEAEMML